MPLKRIYTARDGMEAHFLRGLLEREGIAAVVMGEELVNIQGAVPVGAGSSPTVWVNPGDVARASEIVSGLNRRAGKGRPVAVDDPWVCPNCHEIIEGQFTDCWNCQTPRPGNVQATAARDPALDDQTVQIDLACIACEYNLRGLTVVRRCPECGLPILRTVLDRLREGLSENARELQRLSRLPFESVAARIGFPVAALMLVGHACLRIAEPRINADRIRTAVHDLAIDHFGSEAEAQAGLQQWGIQSDADIKRIIDGLIETGLLDRAEFDFGPNDSRVQEPQ